MKLIQIYYPLKERKQQSVEKKHNHVKIESYPLKLNIAGRYFLHYKLTNETNERTVGKIKLLNSNRNSLV